MSNNISRREFLKLAGMALGSLAFTSFPDPHDEHSLPDTFLGRVTRDSSIFREPSWPEGETLGYFHPDDLVNIYYELTPPSGPPYNPKWYRVWNGYLHSGYVQRVEFRYNKIADNILESGQLCEVTIPYTQIYQYSRTYGWEKRSRLYYSSTHWAVGIDEGPDRQPWVRLYDELREDQYHVPASHVRIISESEIAPISPDIPPEEKRIEVSIQNQILVAYEGDQPVFQSSISSGLNQQPDPEALPWDTPQGQFNIMSKMPSKHMGDGNLAAEGYDLPGVPWTCFFTPEGHAFHGAYWHDNFGIQMSHGCVNMPAEKAKWLFRWTTPVFKTPIEGHADWERRGFGTRVIVN
jgi:lipoprotein-anchoring transpeptidase ErfK/SrfK